MYWKLISKDNIILHKETGEVYDLLDVYSVLRLINRLNDYTVELSDLDGIISSLEWENENLRLENKYLRRHIKEKK